MQAITELKRASRSVHHEAHARDKDLKQHRQVVVDEKVAHIVRAARMYRRSYTRLRAANEAAKAASSRTLQELSQCYRYCICHIIYRI